MWPTGVCVCVWLTGVCVYVCPPRVFVCKWPMGVCACLWPTGVIVQMLVGPFYSVRVWFNVGRPNLCVCIILLEDPIIFM